MNLQGDFEGLTLASILQLLCNDQKTGILTVTRKNEESRVLLISKFSWSKLSD